MWNSCKKVASCRNQFDSFSCVSRQGVSRKKLAREKLARDKPFEDSQEAIDRAIAANCDGEGWCGLGQVSVFLRREIPGFNQKRYRKSKLSVLVESMGCYDVRRTKNGWRIRAKAA